MQTVSLTDYKNFVSTNTAENQLQITTPVRICIPRGGFSNHVRWLILLSEKFTNLETLNCPGFIFNKTYFPLKTKERVTFIFEQIYTNERTYHNWLSLEKITNIKLQPYIGLCHDTKFLSTEKNIQYKTLLANVNVTTSIKHWFKLHPFWLNVGNKKFTQKDFEYQLISQNNEILNYVSKVNEQTLLFNSDILNMEMLDKEWYDNICKFLDIENVYEDASIVHAQWYKLVKKSELDILDFFNTHTYPNFPWQEYTNYFNNSCTEQEYHNIKETVLKFYA